MNMNRIVHDKQLNQAIISTICYFNLFNHPLTIHECWQYLISSRAWSLDDVSQCLEKGIDGIEGTGAFFHRMGRSFLAAERLSRYLIAERKYRAALRFTRLAALVPGIRMVAVCNTLAFSAARDESDIDFFIIARAGSLWFARAACGILALLCGTRPVGNERKDTYCLSFFVSDRALDLSSIALEPHRPRDDIYLAHWVSMCVPLFDDGNAYDEFWKANEWACDVLPHRSPYRTNDLRSVRHGFALTLLRACCEGIYFSIRLPIEWFCRCVQMRAFPHTLCIEAQKNNTHVVISDSLLKFHTNDQRASLRERWRASL